MVYVRADGNNKIGMGHMMRCMAIAREIVKKGEKVTFLLADDSPAETLEDAGFSYIVLHTDYTDMESEKESLEKLPLKDTKFLVDSYFVTNTYFQMLKEYGIVFYIDDVAKFDYHVDCVINGNIYGDKLEYNAPLVLGGYRYAPIRSEFLEAREHCTPRNLLITTGGSDPYFLTESILKRLLEDTQLSRESMDVVCGKFSDSYEKLLEMTKDMPSITIHKNVSNMWELMQRAKVAVTAGGTTMTELSAMGIPMVCFSFVDNQDRIVDTFLKEGYVYYGGFYQEKKEILVEEVVASLKELVTKETLRKEYAEKLQKLVDGKGSQRIAEAILKYAR